MPHPSRREFFQQLAGGTSLALGVSQGQAGPRVPPVPFADASGPTDLPPTYGIPLDLAPAKWIWLPAGRTLPNTFLFFRRAVRLSERPVRATGWILGESRYRLHLNGQRVQWGPAPFDPRWAEADPVDLTSQLQLGDNVIGTEVLYYGFGDGTMPIGKPGFIFKLDLAYASGRTESVVSDEGWQVKVAHAWPPGQYKRWYLRSLQEAFDARLYPADWHTAVNPASGPDGGAWFQAAPIPGALANKPIIASWSRDYLYDSGGGNLKEVELRQRSVAMVKENLVPIKKLTAQAVLRWKTSPDEFFQFDLPEAQCFTASRENFVSQSAGNQFVFELKKDTSAALTFEFDVQSVGFPYFTIDAPEGTVVELLVHEGHDPQGKYVLLNTHFNSWTKFICKAGKNTFEVFDYESLRWLQLHVRNAEGSIKITDIGLRRREYPFANPPKFQCADPKLTKLFAACVNTIYNNTQETIVDGMARERQQYSGDLGHMVHGIARGFGEVPILARFVNTYSQGLTKAGFFLDTWPAYDRLARLMEREIGITEWGPLVDHGVGFNFDCYYYYLYTGDLAALKEVYPRLKTFFIFLQKIQLPGGTMPVENLGIPAVWIDHVAYQQQRHKECAFSLYVAAMCRQALAPLALAHGDAVFAKQVTTFGQKVLAATQQKFWDPARQVYVCNRPWAEAEKGLRYCDRSLGMAVLYDLNVGNRHANSLQLLADRPAELGLSYPTNAVWRYWALAKGQRIDVLLREFRTYWYEAPSVQLNHVLAEFLEVKPDTSAQWSHASIAPLFSMYMDVAGIRPLKPGYAEVEIAPQLGDLEELALTNYTVRGPIDVAFRQNAGKLTADIRLPEGITGTLVWKNARHALKTGASRLVL
jgi:alpha-L-rhamnosidase